MTDNDDLLFLRDHAHSFSIEVNEHRAYYQSLADFLHEERERFRLDDAEIARIVAADQLVSVQVYPSTPIGFFKITSEDLRDALRRACVALEAKQGTW